MALIGAPNDPIAPTDRLSVATDIRAAQVFASPRIYGSPLQADLLNV